MNNSQPSSTSLLWLMAGLTLGALPHFIYQPLWVAVMFIAMIIWRIMAIRSVWPLPTKRFSSLKVFHLSIAGIAFLLLFISYGNLIGRDAGVALLTVMLGLKVVEIRNHRDYYISCFLGYFLVVTNFFYSQNIPTALLMFVVVVIMTASLISLNDGKKSLSNKELIKLASQMLLQAVPLMLLLFVLFPRIPGPLWGLPQDAHSGKTGIDDSMTLGKISQLILSDEIAFRVKFDGDIPPPSKLYWRGPVLWQTDGTTWTELNNHYLMSSRPNFTTRGDEYVYITTLEPHNKRWLFALDFPTEQPSTPASHYTYDGQLRSIKPINQRQQIHLKSHTQYSLNPHKDDYIDAALKLPGDIHPRTKQLAQSWLNQSTEPMQLVEKALTYFNQNNFYYTLTPPKLTGDTIDSFLFESRRGFCEHYAASFTVLMRAAGVPARIVTGYLGGEINPVDDFLVVRQRDAHAWVEVWIKDRGWIRVDPTSAVSRQRIEQGMSTIMPEGFNTPLFMANSRKLIDLWQQIRNNWDALDNAWNQSILAYGPELQKEFLQKLGMAKPDWQTMALWLAIGFAVITLIISFYLFYHLPKRDPVSKLYYIFCKKAAGVGFLRLQQQGPLDFSSLLKKQYPHLNKEIDHITSLYIDLHYGKKTASISDLHQAIRRFRFTPPG
tara:strand:- start:15961 stop:17949 length:1989 start_codon:yes stop_codon:yes gene_type:complete